MDGDFLLDLCFGIGCYQATLCIFLPQISHRYEQVDISYPFMKAYMKLHQLPINILHSCAFNCKELCMQLQPKKLKNGRSTWDWFWMLSNIHMWAGTLRLRLEGNREGPDRSLHGTFCNYHSHLEACYWGGSPEVDLSSCDTRCGTEDSWFSTIFQQIMHCAFLLFWNPTSFGQVCNWIDLHVHQSEIQWKEYGWPIPYSCTWPYVCWCCVEHQSPLVMYLWPMCI